jgi:hypothetical protein
MRGLINIIPIGLVKYFAKKYTHQTRQYITIYQSAWTDGDEIDDRLLIDKAIQVDCYSVGPNCMLVYTHKSELEKKRDEL